MLPAVDVDGGETTLERGEEDEAVGERGRAASEAARGPEVRVEAGAHGDGVEDGGRFLATATHVPRGAKATALAQSRAARRATAKARASSKHVMDHARRRLRRGRELPVVPGGPATFGALSRNPGFVARAR